MKNMQFETTVILESETYSILSGDFEADGFSSGYVLFQALIQAYTKSTISETMEFKPWLSKIYRAYLKSNF